MKYLIAAACLGSIVWVTVSYFRRLPPLSPKARFFTIRAWAFTAVIALLFVMAFLFLPDKGRVLMLVPLFLFGVTVTKWITRARDRLRQEEQQRSNFERARRIN